jgi:hypothetical protein
MVKPLVFNGISIYRGAFKDSIEFIEAVEFSVESALGLPVWEPATVMHADGSITESTVRTNEFLFLPVAEELDEYEESSRKLLSAEIHKHVLPCIADFCARFSIDSDLNVPTAYQLLRYHESQYYIPHLDDGKNTRRRVSMVAYLNDDFDGGELNFPFINFKYYPMAGDVVVFPSGAPYTHEAMPVRQGVKYSVVNWWV